MIAQDEKMECPYCSKKAELKDSSVIYGKSYGLIYICSDYPSCDSYVGVHPGTTIPLGRMANKELREYKKKVHVLFDPLWKGKKIRRNEAYKRLSDALNLSTKECHVGMFDVETCKRAIEVLNRKELQ